MTINSNHNKYIRLIFVCVLFAFAVKVSANAVNKYALLIGIDEYRAVTDLRGAVNDVELMQSILTAKFDVPAENIKTLTNEQATRDNIITAIQTHLIDRAKAGDVVILHYSGHGSQMSDQPDGDEIDGKDETIVPHDSRTQGVFDISDDEINGLLNQLTQRTKNITFILDSCHSGAAARAGNQVRRIEADDRPPPEQPDFAVSTRDGEGEAGIRLNGSDYVLISGALSSELANESRFDGRRHGAMTWHMAQALLTATDQMTYRSLMDTVKSKVTNQFPSQHPQIEGPGMDLKVFGTDKINARPYVLVGSVEGGTVNLEGGRLLGLVPDAELEVFSPQTSDFDNSEAVASLRVIKIEDFSAQAEIISGGEVSPQSKALIAAPGFGHNAITVFVDETVSDSLAAIKQGLEDYQALDLVAAADQALLVVDQRQNAIAVFSGDLEQLAPMVSVSEQDHVQRVVDQVKDIIHWRSLRDLDNPGSALGVSIELSQQDEAGETSNPSVVAPSQQLSYKVQNLESDKDLYIYVLDVSSDGSVALLYPPAGEQQPLPAGASLEKQVEMFLPEGLNAVTDVFKVIATTKPIDPWIFPQGAIRSAATQDTRSISDPLSRFMADALRGTRGARPVNVDSWATAQRTVIVRPPQVASTGFTLSFDEPADEDALTASLGGTRDLCDENQSPEENPCIEVYPVSGDNTAFEINASELSRSDQQLKSVGALFDEAYEIQELTGAVRAEPNLQIEVPGVIDQQGIDKREILGDDAHDPAARDDDQWNLKQVNVLDAWQKIRDTQGLNEGQEGSGILVAHTDTGYLDHPENWEQVNGIRPIDAGKGYDYYDGDADATDPLLSDSPLDNPGHGTASASVIVSPPDCQLQEAQGCVHGVARGAQLIPLRVHRTVSQINTSNLAKAVRDVAEGNIDGNPKLISTAMGGPPSFNLYRAVKSAQDNGVLMVAAAGNYVRFTVWPARFKSTIAAAAVNVRCRPWKHSSRGRKVDISAPGESVWRATLNEDLEYINGMGKGTTFATGNTSAAAALWLAHHKDNPELAELQQNGQVTQAFRQALKNTAWQPSGNDQDPPGTHCETFEWNSNQFGPGILDINALLEAPINVPATRSLTTAELDQIPLFASLYDDEVPAEKIIGDYRALLKVKPDTPLEDISQFETEILHHYTLDEDVQRSLQAIVDGQRGDEPFDRAREFLLQMNLSKTLRQIMDG